MCLLTYLCVCFPYFKRKLRKFCLGDLTSSLGFLWAVPQTTLLNYPVTGNSNLDCGTLAAFPTKTHGKETKRFRPKRKGKGWKTGFQPWSNFENEG